MRWRRGDWRPPANVRQSPTGRREPSAEGCDRRWAAPQGLDTAWGAVMERNAGPAVRRSTDIASMTSPLRGLFSLTATWSAVGFGPEPLYRARRVRTYPRIHDFPALSSWNQ